MFMNLVQDVDFQCHWYRSGDGSTLTEHNGIAGYYGHSSGGSSSGHCSATSMSYDSSCSTDSSRKSSNSSTNGSANTVGGNSRYDFKINYVYEKLDILGPKLLLAMGCVKLGN